MLTLTKKTEYALIAACHLANNGHEVVSARHMSDYFGIRLPLLMNVLKMMNQAGLLQSVRGARGGYALSVPPKQISLSQLIEAVEGPPRLVKCALPREDDPICELSEACPVRVPMGKIHRMFRSFLRGISVADVAFDSKYAGKRRSEIKQA